MKTAARDAAVLAEQQVSERLREFAGREEQLKEAARAEWFEAGQQQVRAEALAAQAARDADALAAQAARDAEAQAAADAAAAQLDGTPRPCNWPNFATRRRNRRGAGQRHAALR